MENVFFCDRHPCAKHVGPEHHKQMGGEHKVVGYEYTFLSEVMIDL
jgi:hypothetical protein